MIGYIYMTINTLTHEKYIGLHTATKFEGRKYMGSGVRLQEAFKHYGKENFDVLMLDSADTYEELEKLEIFYIDKFNAVEDPMFYNIAEGGHAGGGKVIPSLSSRKQMSVSAKKRGNCLSEYGKSRCTKYGEDNGFYGKHHSNETILHLSEVHKNRVWVNNGINNKHVKQEELLHYLNNGYIKGMLPKRCSTLNRIWIHNDSGQRKMIDKSDLHKYPSWHLGVGKRINSPSSTTIVTE